MPEPRVVFVDYPGVDPCQLDNPICVQTCPVRGRWRDEDCPYFPQDTLRQAISHGFTEKRDDSAYPVEWLDRWVVVCYGNRVCIRFGWGKAER